MGIDLLHRLRAFGRKLVFWAAESDDPASLLNTVLVLTNDFQGAVDPIRYFPDQNCLDTSSNNMIARYRLSNATAVPAQIGDCNTGALYWVTRCNAR
jgi:hypothetical protein